MNGGYTDPRPSRGALLGIVFILAMLVTGALGPRAHAARVTSRVADVPAPVSVTYHFAAQMVQGATAGRAMAGQLSGTMDYTSALTATLTLTTGITATVTGAFTNTTSLAPTSLRVRGRAWAMTLNGHAYSSKSGQFGGAITVGGTSGVGSWVITPQTTHIGFDIGGTSIKGSAHKVSIGGALSMMATADGWADGTFTLLTNGKVVPAEGRLVNGNLSVTLHLPEGDVMAVGTSRPFLQLSKWSGTFVGPGMGDQGTWSGEG
jgi:hypothetical protein